VNLHLLIGNRDQTGQSLSLDDLHRIPHIQLGGELPAHMSGGDEASQPWSQGW
jgi:hypothetical protein